MTQEELYNDFELNLVHAEITALVDQLHEHVTASRDEESFLVTDRIKELMTWASSSVDRASHF